MSPSRRTLLRTAGSALLATVTGCSEALTGTPTRTVSPAPVPTNWQTDLGPDLRTRPVVGREAVYTAVAGSDGDRTELVALDRTAGSERGRQPVRGAVHGQPVPCPGGCAFGTHRPERPVGSLALLGPDGAVRWRTPPVRGEPTPLGAADSAVVVGWRAIPRPDRTPIVPREEHGHATSVPASTPTATATPVERIEQGVIAYDVDGGSVRWTAPLGGVSEPPTVVAGSVYAVGHGVVACLDASTGGERWRRDLGAGSATPAIVDGTVYVRLGRWLDALDATAGRERQLLVAGEGADLTPLATGHGWMVVGSTNGTVYAFGGGA